MIAGELRQQTKELLDETIPEKKDLDDKVRQLIEAEYLRQLGRHKRTNSALTDKYGMTFEEFVERRIAREKGYTWEVEQDAMAWETAIGGIAAMERQLQKVRDLGER